MEKKNDYFSYFVILLIVIITSAILGLVKLLWWYYPIGVVIGIITHVLMLIQNKRFFRIQQNDLEKATYSPKKDAFLWYGLRILVDVIGLAGVILLAKFLNPDRMLETALMVLGGVLTVKGFFIIMLLIKKEGR